MLNDLTPIQYVYPSYHLCVLHYTLQFIIADSRDALYICGTPLNGSESNRYR